MRCILSLIMNVIIMPDYYYYNMFVYEYNMLDCSLLQHFNLLIWKAFQLEIIVLNVLIYGTDNNVSLFIMDPNMPIRLWLLACHICMNILLKFFHGPNRRIKNNMKDWTWIIHLKNEVNEDGYQMFNHAFFIILIVINFEPSRA